MPRRDDFTRVLVIGSGPIKIGQACEFDYSGTQACRALKDEGYEVVLVNSNPATIMTDPEFADRTYLEPLTHDIVAAIIEREKPDAVLPTLGGQTALNLTVELTRSGVLDRAGVEVIGARPDTIQLAEEREAFRDAMREIGLAVPLAATARSVDEAVRLAREIGYPAMVRPSYILGGKGTGVAADQDELERVVARGLAASPVGEVLVEQSIAGWKEYELEVMRDRADNCVVVCSIENVDPVGVHTGDSITVAPAQTLSDTEFQAMRDAAFACVRRVGVETGGSNVQFAIDPANGRMTIIEMNPRVSRSSALASKATGFPIAKIATLLAVGYTLDELTNDITAETPACFEPALDYVVTKIPRWGFAKFSGVDDRLGTAMRSVGEAMAIGRTFPESLQKCVRSLETGRLGLNCDAGEQQWERLSDDELRQAVSVPSPDRLFGVESALRRGIPVEELRTVTGIDLWFLDQIAEIASARGDLAGLGEPADLSGLSASDWRGARRLGYGDAQLAWLWGRSEEDVREARLAKGVRAVFKSVDTCAAEFAAATPYVYSTSEREDDETGRHRPSVIILGSGPNRIGQGVEFDYCCVEAGLTLRDADFDTVIINCNPETVSTDYDISDRLYFEPVAPEEVRAVIEFERAHGEVVGVIASLGGQTAIDVAETLPAEWILGTPPDAVALAEDRGRWSRLCAELDVSQPPSVTVDSLEDAHEAAADFGYPLLIRPSYVLSGSGMRIVTSDGELDRAVADLGELGAGAISKSRPLLVDRFMADAVELDVDLVRDRAGDILVGAVMEHVEPAGVHSGDSACVIPPQTLSESTVATVCEQSERIAGALGIRGLLNLQFGVTPDGEVFVIEANPRASRTVPFVSKATGTPLARLAARVATGETLARLRSAGMVNAGHDDPPVCVKEVLLPFDHFPDSRDHLGPEMRSTGEVFGMGRTFTEAFGKAQWACGPELPAGGKAWLRLRDGSAEEHRALLGDLRRAGFTVSSAPAPGERTSESPEDQLTEQTEEEALRLLDNGQLQLVVDLPGKVRLPMTETDRRLRAETARLGVPYLTTLRAARSAAAVAADPMARDRVRSLQEMHDHTLRRNDLDSTRMQPASAASRTLA